MDRTSSCNSIGCTAVKCTAVFALVTLFHTLFALSGRGLLFQEYFTQRVHFSSGALNLAIVDDQRDGDYGNEDIIGVKRIASVSQHHDHLRSSEEEEEQDHELIIDQSWSNHQWKNSTQPQPTSRSDDPVTFSPKRAYSPLGEKEISKVETFVFFVGYSRSGHSIVASLLDAHPNIIIAHEYNLFRRWKGSMYQNRSFLYNELYQNSFNNAEKGWRSAVKNQKGYTLAVEDSWQGAFENLLVIGEKSGAVTAQTYDNDPWSFIEALEELHHTVQVPIKVIHVVRNPYDIISTRLLYMDGKTHKSKVHATVDMKHVSPRNLSSQVNRTIHLVQNVQELLQNCSLNSLEIHTADLVLDPKHVIINLCMFLGVECSQEYLKQCSDKIFARQSQTRYLVEWPEELIEKVYQMIIRPYQPFWRYTFTSR